MTKVQNRQVAEVRNDSIDEDNRTVTFVFSTDAVDRHGTVVNQDGWDLSEFERNPIIGYQHDVYGDMCAKPDPDDVIGRAMNMRVESMGDRKALVGDVQFEDAETNEKAEKVFRKIKNGTLSMGSVGFMEIGKGQFGRTNEKGEVENPDVYYFRGQQLLEFSIVNIPSNPEAQSRSIKRSLNRALPYLKDVLGSQYSLADIEKMKVGTVLKAADGESIEDETRESFTDYPEEASLNAKTALDARDNGEVDCGTEVGWVRANQLANREPVSEETVARMAAFRRHEQNKEGDPYEDCGSQMWLAWGGDAGISWAENKMDEIEGQQNSYNGEENAGDLQFMQKMLDLKRKSI